PHQHGRGQGNGSEIRYPVGTEHQLLALCHLHVQFRKLSVVGWYLWLNGFPVGDKYWQQPLMAAAQLFDNGCRVLKGKGFDGRGGSQNISDMVHIVLSIAIGHYRLASQPTEQAISAERQVIEQPFGFARARTDLLSNGPPLITGAIEPILERLSDQLSEITITR